MSVRRFHSNMVAAFPRHCDYAYAGRHYKNTLWKKLCRFFFRPEWNYQ